MLLRSAALEAAILRNRYVCIHMNVVNKCGNVDNGSRCTRERTYFTISNSMALCTLTTVPAS